MGQMTEEITGRSADESDILDRRKRMKELLVNRKVIDLTRDREPCDSYYSSIIGVILRE